MKKELVREPVTFLELGVMEKLARCRFSPATWTKRFVSRTCSEKGSLTAKQRYWIARICLKYRRQIVFQPEEFLWCVETGKWTPEELDKMKLTKMAAEARGASTPSLFEVSA